MKRLTNCCTFLFAIALVGLQSLQAYEPIHMVICNDSPTVRFAAAQVIARFNRDKSEQRMWQNYINALALTESQTNGTLDSY